MRPTLPLLAAAGALLAGCSAFQAPEGEPPVPWVEPSPAQPASNAESLMLYFQRISKLSGPDFAKEHEAARQSYAQSGADYDRVRLAMTLSVPGTPFSSDARALKLLEPVARSPDGSLQGLAYLMASYLEERRRLDATAQGLQHKLEALRSLERSLIERRR